MSRFAIKAIWADGTEEYLKRGHGAGNVATFVTKGNAEDQVEFMKIGMEGDLDVQSINVVRAPTSTADEGKEVIHRTRRTP